MTESIKIFAGVVALALLVGASYFLVQHNERVGNEAGVVKPPEYTNAEFDFSFIYPSGLEITEYTDQVITITDPAQENAGIVDITVEIADTDTSYTDLKEFIHTRAPLYCEADGPGGRMSCSKVSREQSFTTATGISGEIFYLELTHRDGDSATVREAGPFYAFDMSSGILEADFSALLVRPSKFAEESEMYDRGAQIANDIVNTLRLGE